jgi:monoamine oxidase
MNRMSRRGLLLGTAATLAAPALALAQSGDVDVVIVGAGAAGIAAARRVIAAGRRCVVLEASDRIGGRCFTDTRTFDVPYDRGAHWLHSPDLNPLTKIARGTGLDVYAAPRGQRLRLGRRFGREGELEDFLAAVVRGSRAIGDAARNPKDIPASQALPAKELGDWRQTVEFTLGAFGAGRDLDEISAQDFSKATERGEAMFCREGLGTLVAKLADPSIIRLSTQVNQIHTWGRGVVEAQTNKGTVRGRSAIVTVSTGVLAAGKLRFDPVLPRRHLDAIAKLPMGNYEHVAVQFNGNPLGLETDDLVFEKSTGPATAALLANVSGTSLCLVEIGGRHARTLAQSGERAMIAFATDWLANVFGSQIKNEISKAHATQWIKEPWILGSMAAASVGGAGMRRALMEPVRDRVYFAGEAVHETLYGTVGGAWESGDRAAELALKRLGGGGAGPVARRPATRGAPKRTQQQPPSSFPGTLILRGRD